MVSRVRHLQGIGVDRMGDVANTSRDPNLLRLENLDTDLRPAEAVLAATRAAVDLDAANSYLPFSGGEALRAAAAAHVSQMSGVAYEPLTSCVITAGGLNGILNTLLATLEPGDEVLLTDPVYIGLINRVRLAGGEPRFLPLRPSKVGWKLDRAALRAVSSRPRVVLMMSPSMPTGCMLDADDWRLVAERVQEWGAWLLYDAAMERIVFGKRGIHPASLPALAPRTITVGSLSKEQRMIGWRVGWVVGPPSIVRDIAQVGISNVVCQVGIAQAAGVAALSEPAADIEREVRIWQGRYETVRAELEGLPLIPADGGWSVLLDAQPLGMSGEQLSQRLLQYGQVAATAMTGWGSEDASRYLRLVFANEPRERLIGLGARVRRALN